MENNRGVKGVCTGSSLCGRFMCDLQEKRGKNPHCRPNKTWFLVVKSKSDGTNPETPVLFLYFTSQPDVCCQNVVSFIPSFIKFLQSRALKSL